MYTFFYSNISGFAADLEVMLDEEAYKTSIQNMHKLVWKSNYFKYYILSMLCHGYGVSKYLQYMTKKKKNVTMAISGKLFR